MYISPNSNSPQPHSNTAPSGDETVLNSDYETFLKMLTAQMMNQDPLNPVDSADYAVQLATFSSVEQQVLTNDLLSAVQAQLNTMSISQLAGWVGMDAQARAPGLFDGSPVEVSTHPDEIADRVELIVRNSDGVEMYRSPVENGQRTLEWQGISSDGSTVPEGLYSFSTESFSKGLSLGEKEADVYSRIVEARSREGEILLVLEGGAVVNSSDVAGLRNPD